MNRPVPMAPPSDNMIRWRVLMARFNEVFYGESVEDCGGGVADCIENQTMGLKLYSSF